ncbi:MAG: alpha,alpha-trehalase TreF [Bacteroidota bacterium]|nr:alpha,alpha-trehalase TreF [Bacteroidota bacterium]
MESENIFSLGELFDRVQLECIFPDGKTFVDCTPKKDLSSIRQRYEEQKDEPNFSLSFFVHEYFIEPKSMSSGYTSDTNRPIEKHLELLWDVLTRQPEETHDSLIDLPDPYVVPGGRFREIYYWDSYFTMLGLQVSNRVEMIQNMINNFCYLIDRFGYIPNGNRTYFVGRSQPPFFSCMVQLLAEEKGKNILVEYLPRLEKEYAFWMMGMEELGTSTKHINRVSVLPDGSILNHYWDEHNFPRPEAYRAEIELATSSNDENRLYRHLRAACESGWDFSSRWFKDVNDFSSIHASDIIPVDLNCLLFHLEKTIAEGFELAGNIKSSEEFNALAAARKEAINKYCWNEAGGFYFDYDYVNTRQKKSLTLAAAFPLFFEIASQAQAESVAKNLQQHFLKAGGLISTTETTGQQWDAPNGWAPLQWMAIKGLRNYKQDELAKEIAKRWMNINEKVYRDTGQMMEKYNVVETNIKAGGGEYPSQDGFGWTNGVYLALEKVFGKL